MRAASLRPTLALLASIPCLVAIAPAGAVVLALNGVAGLVRWTARRLEPPFADWTALIEFDPVLGWRPRPRLDTHYLAAGDDLFHVVTDGDGWPGRTSIEESEVVVIGDSFAFGYGADAGASYAARARQARVKAVGAPGYSMVQGVRLIETLGERLRGKLVVWFVFLENDLQDNLAPEMRQYRAPFARRDPRQGGWEIADRHLTERPWRTSNLDVRRLFPAFCVEGPLASRAFAACDYLLTRAQAGCHGVGAELVVFTIPCVEQLTPAGRQELARRSGQPDRCDPGLPDRRLAETCRRLGLPIVIGREHLVAADYKVREGVHWSARGHRQMARLLETLHGAFRAGQLVRRDSSPPAAASASAAPDLMTRPTPV